MEFMQVIKQMALGRTIQLNSKVSVAIEKSGTTIPGLDLTKKTEVINFQVLQLLQHHMKEYYSIALNK